jgi:hypothetical protein
MISSKQASDDIDNPIDGGNIKCKKRREQTYMYMYEEKKRREGDAGVGDQGRIPLDQDVMVEEATDIATTPA